MSHLASRVISHVVCFGECMLELQGEAFGTMQQTFGGDTLNTAVYLARCGRAQGLRVSYATALGDDRLSTGLIERWLAEGVAVDGVRRIASAAPGLYLIDVDGRGERHFSYWRDGSAARRYFETPDGQTPLELQAATIDALYLSGISLAILPAAGRARLLALAERLVHRGALVAFDSNYRPRLWADAKAARDCYAQIYALAQIALVTLDDQFALWGDAPCDDELERTLRLPCPELIVKRGADSTLLRIAGQPLHAAPTERVAQVVDTTAAGDAFAGAYLARRLAGADPKAAARAGNRLAARVVQHRGALIPLAAMQDLLGAA